MVQLLRSADIFVKFEAIVKGKPLGLRSLWVVAWLLNYSFQRPYPAALHPFPSPQLPLNAHVGWHTKLRRFSKVGLEDRQIDWRGFCCGLVLILAGISGL